MENTPKLKGKKCNTKYKRKKDIQRKTYKGE